MVQKIHRQLDLNLGPPVPLSAALPSVLSHHIGVGRGWGVEKPFFAINDLQLTHGEKERKKEFQVERKKEQKEMLIYNIMEIRKTKKIENIFNVMASGGHYSSIYSWKAADWSVILFDLRISFFQNWCDKGFFPAIWKTSLFNWPIEDISQWCHKWLDALLQLLLAKSIYSCTLLIVQLFRYLQ